MTSPDEQKDIDRLLKGISDLRLQNHSFMEAIMRMEPQDLKNSGHKTVEGALLWSMKDTMTKVKRLQDAHLKRWPD